MTLHFEVNQCQSIALHLLLSWVGPHPPDPVPCNPLIQNWQSSMCITMCTTPQCAMAGS